MSTKSTFSPSKFMEVFARSRFRSWEELAAAADVHRTTFSRWKSGKNEPRAKQLAAVATLFGVKVADFNG